MRSKEVDFAKGSCAYSYTTSCSICGEIKMTIRSGDALGQFLKKKKKENSTDSRTGRLRYIYSTLSIYLARVELLVRCLKRLISPGAPSLEAFYTHVISAPSLHRASTDALIVQVMIRD